MTSKTYLRWHTVHAVAPSLSSASRERGFQFLWQEPCVACLNCDRAGSAALPRVDEQPRGKLSARSLSAAPLVRSLKQSALQMTKQIEQAMAE